MRKINKKKIIAYFDDFYFSEIIEGVKRPSRIAPPATTTTVSLTVTATTSGIGMGTGNSNVDQVTTNLLSTQTQNQNQKLESSSLLSAPHIETSMGKTGSSSSAEEVKSKDLLLRPALDDVIAKGQTEEEVYQMMVRCWSEDALARPDFPALKTFMRKLNK